MLIKIIRGTYGYTNKYGRIEPKNKNDAAFEVADAEGRRLILMKVAEEVTSLNQKRETKESEKAPAEPQAKTLEEPKESSEEEAEDKPYEEMAYNNLKHLAKERGLDTTGTKKDLIARLEDDAPVLSVEEAK
jgi:LAS superfamily LD-carboxypeptidase LdcB